MCVVGSAADISGPSSRLPPLPPRQAVAGASSSPAAPCHVSASSAPSQRLTALPPSQLPAPQPAAAQGTGQHPAFPRAVQERPATRSHGSSTGAQLPVPAAPATRQHAAPVIVLSGTAIAVGQQPPASATPYQPPASSAQLPTQRANTTAAPSTGNSHDSWHSLLM